VAQIVFVCLVLASLGFGLGLRYLTVSMMAIVAVLTLLSMAVYVRDWVRHVNSATMER
jgi:cardiolipin synthase